MITLNEYQVSPTLFPDGTSQVWGLPIEILSKPNHKIVWEFESEAEIMHLAQLRALLGKDNDGVSLYMPFLPYARQDKFVSNQTTFALKTFAKFINALHFDDVTALDVHSLKAERMINNFTSITPIDYIRRAVNLCFELPSNICYPDKGALERYAYISSNTFGYYYTQLYGSKTREPSTGLIKDYTVHDYSGQKQVLIIDDICDGGMTFILLAKALKDLGVEHIYLYVTHGIFSRGLKPLIDAGIERIFIYKGEVFHFQDNKIVYKPYGES